MSKLFKNFFVFALVLLVAAFQVQADPIIYWETDGLKSNGTHQLTFDTDKLKLNEQYVVLKESNDAIYQGLTTVVEKATKFTIVDGKIKVTIGGTEKDLTFDEKTKGISTIGSVSLKVSDNHEIITIGKDENINLIETIYVVPAPDLFWKDGLSFDSSGDPLTVDSDSNCIKVGNNCLSLKLNGDKFDQKLETSGTAIKQHSGKWEFTEGDSTCILVNDGNGTLIVEVDGSKHNISQSEIQNIGEWKFTGRSTLILVNEGNGAVIVKIGHAEHSIPQDAIQSVGEWKFTQSGSTCTLDKDENGKIFVASGNSKYSINAYNAPTLYWWYNLELVSTKGAAKYSPATGKICFNSSACLLLKKNNSEISQSLDLTSPATRFTPSTSESTEWKFEIDKGEFSIKQNPTCPKHVVIFDGENEVKVSAYSGPRLEGSSSIVTPLFCTIFVTLAVATFAL